MKRSKKINIAIVDDFELTLNGWKETFKDYPDFNIIGTALNKEVFLKLCNENREILDVLIMDKNIDGKTQFDDFNFIEEVRKEFPKQKIIVYTWDYYTGHINYLRQLKVNGYIPSKIAVKVMAEAITCVMSGIPYYPNTLDSKAADKSGYNKGHEFDIEFIRMVSELSPAQNRVAELLAHDMLNPQIAQKLSISISAVENNINQIYEKLNISHKEEQPRSKFNHFFGEYFRQRSNGVK